MSQENDISSIEYLRETYSETKTAHLLHHEDKTTIVTESPKNESPEEKSFMGSDFRNLALVVAVIVSISAGHWFCHSISFTASPPSFFSSL